MSKNEIAGLDWAANRLVPGLANCILDRIVAGLNESQLTIDEAD